MNPKATFSNFLTQIYDLPTDSLSALVNLFEPLSLKKNDYYVRQGDHPKKIGFLSKGIVRIFFQNQDGEEFNKIFLQAPSLVAAYSSLISGNMNQVNIQCLSDCSMIEANYSEVLGLFDTHKGIESLNRKVVEQFFIETEKRQMSLIMLNASERYDLFRKEFPAYENYIPQYHIASYLGITPTQLSRIRAKK